MSRREASHVSGRTSPAAGRPGAPAAGHRIVPHTADLALEAWAPTREECVAEAVSALVDSVTGGTSATGGQRVAFAAPAAPDEDLLLAVLDEVIFQLDVYGRLPVAVAVGAPAGPGEGEGASGAGGPGGAPGAPGEPPEGRVTVRFTTVPVDAVRATGAAPKAVSLYELRFGPVAGGWRCHVTVDV